MMQLFDDPIELENSRVILKPLSLDLINDIAQFALDEKIWEFSSKTPRQLNRDGIEHMVRNLLQERNVKHSYPFVIFDRQIGKTVGLVKFENIVNRHCRLDIGSTLIGSNYQKKGVMSSVFYLLVDFAFNELDAIRVGFSVDVRNLAAIQFCHKMGAKSEGVLRSYIINNDGKICDIHVFSVLVDEWTTIKKLSES